VSNLNNDIRKAEVEDTSNNVIDFSSPEFSNRIIETVTELKKPTNKLQTGVIKFNNMLNGGFESGRLYLFLGITGGFKSGTMLNLLYQIKKYNPNFTPSDPTKIPTILYVTQENSVNETMERLWNIGCSEKDIRRFNNEKIVKRFQTREFAINEESNINIVVMYKPAKTISTDDLYSICDDLYDDGKEVICIIHDYVARIRPANYTGELRLDMANIVDEETIIAKTRNIVFITAAQLNRKAMELIEEQTSKGKKTAIDKLGASTVGESFNMLANADWVGIISRDEVIDPNKEDESKYYMTIKQLKVRGKKSTIYNSLTQPFVENNSMKIIDDVETGKSMSIESLETISGSDNSGFNTEKKTKTSTSRRRHQGKISKNKIDEINEMVNDELSDLD